MKALVFTVPGRPVSKNGTYERRRGPGRGLRRSDAAEDFVKRVQAAAIAVVGHRRPMFTGGRVIVTTCAYFTRDADAGAVATLVQDALQGIAYANDREVMLAPPWKGLPDRQNPRTLVAVRQASEAEILTGEIVLQIPMGVVGPVERSGLALIHPEPAGNVTRLRPSVRRPGQ